MIASATATAADLTLSDLLVESARLSESVRTLAALATKVGDRELASVISLIGYAAHALAELLVQRSIDAEGYAP